MTQFLPIFRFQTYGFLLFSLMLFSACKDNTIVDDAKTKQRIPVYDLAEIQQSGKLRALIDNSSTSYFLYKGRPMGFEYELLSRFAKKMGLQLEVIPIQDMNNVIQDLKSEKGDIIAADYTITKDRVSQVSFSESILSSPQVLVQNSNNELIKSPIDLIDHDVYVRKNSSFYERLQNLSEEIGGRIHIKEVAGNVSVEKLIAKVANGEIGLTVADQHVAKINQAFFHNLYIKTPISLEQQMAWAVRQESPNLLIAINKWLVKFKRTTDFRVIYLKYFGNTQLYRSRVESQLYTSKSGRISSYDDILKKQSKTIGWDWRLVASLIYQESQFNHNAESWVGAQGLMQLMPTTAAEFGIDSSASPQQNIHAGIEYLAWIDKQFIDRVSDSTERIKFDLAAYNVGLGHIFDAIRLAVKYNLDPEKWDDNVAEMLLKKSEPDYYNDPVVYYGYCRGSEPYNYVKQIMNRYDHYVNMTDQMATVD